MSLLIPTVMLTSRDAQVGAGSLREKSGTKSNVDWSSFEHAQLYSGQWAVDSGMWTVSSGQWNLDSEMWTVGSGQWNVDSVYWTMDGGQWNGDSAQWTVGSEMWTVGSGQWAVDSWQWAVDSGQLAVGSRQWTVNESMKLLSSHIHQSHDRAKHYSNNWSQKQYVVRFCVGKAPELHHVWTTLHSVQK